MDLLQREKSAKDVAINSLQFVPSPQEPEGGAPPQDAPKAWKIITLTIGLCMGMFCVALVCPPRRRGP